MKFWPFTRLVAVACTLLVAAAAGFAWIVDPYGIYGAPAFAGFNQIKPKSYTHAALAKERRIGRAAPRTALLGNSRIDVGFEPESAHWPEHLRPVFNFGIPGEGIGGLSDHFAIAAQHDSLRAVVIGLDFLDFLSTTAASDAPVGTVSGTLRQVRRSARDVSKTLFSGTAVVDSLVTVMHQGDSYAKHMTPSGFNPFREYVRFVREKGHHAIAQHKNHEVMTALGRRGQSAAVSHGAESTQFRNLRLLLSRVRDSGITAYLLFYPYHADVLEIIRATGRWDALETWKRSVVDLVEAFRVGAPGWKVELWDFAGYDAYTTEAIPMPGDTGTAMNWYWEPSHFKAALGDVILTRLFQAGPADFGARLSSATIEARLADTRRRREAYLDGNRHATSRIADLCRELSCGSPAPRVGAGVRREKVVSGSKNGTSTPSSDAAEVAPARLGF